MAAKEFLTYKGRPLVRKGNEIYYGDMAEKYVILMQIITTKKDGDLDIADKVLVQLLSTDSDLRPKDRIIKKSEKYGLVVLLCHESCHIYGENAVHRNRDVALFLKRWGQNKAMREQGWTEKDFVREFGKNYLEV